MSSPPASPPPTQGRPAAGPPSQPTWALALGTAAVWYLEPALAEMAELVGGVALSNNKAMARGAIAEMRRKAAQLRRQMAPLPASALAKVVRRSEAAGGAVLNKGARMRELQSSWDDLLACLRSTSTPP